MVIGGFSAACAQRILYGGIWLETKLWGVATDKEKTFDSVVSYGMSCLFDDAVCELSVNLSMLNIPLHQSNYLVLFEPVCRKP